MANIELIDVTVEYPIFNIGAMSLRNELVDMGTGGFLKSKRRGHAVVTALSNINITLKNGDRLGLVGHNGSGKSTLLRTMAGIYHPTRGYVQTKGKVSSLFGLSAGMSLELNGYENILRISLLLGLSKKQAESNYEEIRNFTELGNFMSVPVRTYSMGMLTRLLFAIVTSTNPEILLIDEVIGAGDKAFQVKAQERISELIGKSSICVIASHSPDLINRYCNKILELSNGYIVNTQDN